jgi:hypothetical protein
MTQAATPAAAAKIAKPAADETIYRIPFDIPFYSQKIYEENYKEMGFDDLEEGIHWSTRGCGIASLRMIIDGILRSRGEEDCCGQAEMIKRGLDRNAYLLDGDIGWIHSGLAALAGEYGIEAEAKRDLTVDDLAEEIEAGHPCIVSITAWFAGGERWLDGHVFKKGGHLVPAIGTIRKNGELTGFICHHTASIIELNWPDHRAPIERFEASFTGNAIVFRP